MNRFSSVSRVNNSFCLDDVVLSSPHAWAPATALRAPMPFQHTPPRSPLSHTETEKREAVIKVVREVHGLRDDFYSMAVSATQTASPNQYVAVAARDHVCIMASQHRCRAILKGISKTRTRVSCVSASLDGSWIAMGNVDGTLTIYLLGKNMMGKQKPVFQLQLPVAYVTCATWLSNMELLIGTTDGFIHRFRIHKKSKGHGISQLEIHDKPHDDKICNIVVDRAATAKLLIAVGAGDFSVSVWEDTKDGLRLDYVLPQKSAIRAVTFCPFVPRLLVTGTGRNDRTMNVYNAQTRRLVVSVQVPAQIVAIVWLNRWEIFVAFGHSRLSGPQSSAKRPEFGLGQIYSLPSGTCLATVHGHGRSLDAVRVGHEICIATSADELIHFEWTGPGSGDNSSQMLQPRSRVSSPVASPKLR